MKLLLIVALALSFVLAPPAANAAAPSSPAQKLMSKLEWRSIGPFIGGRVVAVAGVPRKPDLFYMGGVQGGVWKSTDYGQNWTNITDGKIPGVADPIGALAVADSNPQRHLRRNRRSRHSRRFRHRRRHLQIDRRRQDVVVRRPARHAHDRQARRSIRANPNVVYAASMGHVFKPNPERGIFKTTDGGKTWRKVLFVDDNTGGVDLSMDKQHPGHALRRDVAGAARAVETHQRRPGQRSV